MSEQNNDNKPRKGILDALRKKSRERLGAFIWKGEDHEDSLEPQEASEALPEPKKHPLYALWILWQQEIHKQAPELINISEDAFLSWFGHDIDLSVKNEDDEQDFDDLPSSEEALTDMEEDVEEEPKPEPTAAQLFCDSLTIMAEGFMRDITLEQKLLQTEIQSKLDKIQRQEEALKAAEEEMINEYGEIILTPTSELPIVDELPENDPEMKPRDAIIKTYISKDVMTGFLFIFPPLFGGNDTSIEAVNEELKKTKITFGVDTAHVEEAIANQQYLQIHTIAHGVLAVPGTDGKIIDHISRVDKINVMEDARGQVDFKQLNIIQNIKKGDPICTLIPPIEGVNGQNVSSKVLPCPRTIMPKTPMGVNTIMSADGIQLLASMDGFASFKYDRFNVENKLVVSGNVDNAVGNINFIGDVYIRGDVLNGFEVRAGGDIHVVGMVEGAFLYAGKDVKIDKGMNGNKQGTIVAGGEVHCRFLENCTIHAVGKVQADSMVWCDVTSDDCVIAGPGKGAIIGGTIVACNNVTAKVIGNKSHQKTNITLGYSAKMLKDREDAEKDLIDAKSTLETLSKNVGYLSGLKALTPEKQQLLNQLVHQKRLYEVKKKSLLTRLSDLDNSISDFSGCFVDGEMIFPPTQVVIGNASRTISNVWFKCHVYYSDGEIKFGTAVD